MQFFRCFFLFYLPHYLFFASRTHETDDDLSDLLEDRMAAMSARIKRSPRRSTSAQELLVAPIPPTTNEKHKCFPIYLSGVIESIDSGQNITR